MYGGLPGFICTGKGRALGGGRREEARGPEQAPGRGCGSREGNREVGSGEG